MKDLIEAFKTIQWRRTPECRHQPLLDHTIGNTTSGVLTWLGKRALKRHDYHEFNHILCALKAGNSSHAGGRNPCQVPTDRTFWRGDDVLLTFPINSPSPHKSES